MAKQEADSQTSLGGFPPGMASRAHPGRQEACVGRSHGSHLRGCPKGNQKQTIDERGLLPRTSMGKNAIGSTEGKETKRERKVLSNSQVKLTRSKVMQTSPSVG